MGFETSMFLLQPVDANLVCSICFCVLEEPTRVCVNAHTACVSEWQDTQFQEDNLNGNAHKCPACREVLVMEVDHPLKTTIGNLTVRCPNNHHAVPNNKKEDETTPSACKRAKKQAPVCCTWEGTLTEYLQEHSVLDCPFVKARSCPDCGVVVGSLEDWKVHQQDHGPSRRVICQFCRLEMRFDKLHTSSLGCPEKEIECHSCHQEMAQRLLGQGQQNSDICQIEYTGHMAECPEISLLCPFGCRGYWKRKDIKAHLNDLALGHCQMLSTTLKRMQEEKEWHKVSME